MVSSKESKDRWRKEHPEYAKTYYNANKDRIKSQQKEYYNKNHEVILEKTRVRSKKRDSELKLKSCTHYGGGEAKCVSCGEDRLVCLSIDHIAGNGAKERRQIGCGAHMYWWLNRNNFPPGYQTLCMNCQWVKRAKNKEY